jgi:sRNA-binding carbon storage regulator CsrA
MTRCLNYFYKTSLLIGIICLFSNCVTVLGIDFPKWERGTHRLVTADMNTVITAAHIALKKTGFKVYKSKADERAYVYLSVRTTTTVITNPTDPYEIDNDEIRIVMQDLKNGDVKISTLMRIQTTPKRQSIFHEEIFERITSEINKIQSDPAYKIRNGLTQFD